MKLALAMICKATDDEAELLNRCLTSVAPYVDGIYVTITGENKRCEDVAKFHGAHISRFKWVNDFSAARNYSFAQVPRDFDHILWLDADDQVRGFENLRAEMEKHPADTYAMFYAYSFDKYNNPDVVHTKTRIVRNDGCVEWRGRLHEEFHENRAITMEFLKGIEILHFSNEERYKAAGERNLEIASVAHKEAPENPIAHFNYAKSLIGVGCKEDGAEEFERFLKRGIGDGERYLSLQYLARIRAELGDMQRALDTVRLAIGLLPDYPDAYHCAGDLCREAHMYEKASQYYISGLALAPQYLRVIVYSPRQYDYVPLLNLAQCYVAMSRPDLAYICFAKAAEVQPGDTKIREIVTMMDKERKKFDRIIKEVKTLEKLHDKKKLKKRLDSLPVEVRSHPSICIVHNQNFIKQASSGKDIDYFCGQSAEEWDPEVVAKEGRGGSEEAVVHLAKRWAAAGWNVTVYNACGTKEQVFDGVTYRPWWSFNGRDRRDVLVVWRHPGILDHNVNAAKVFVDLHDVISPGEFTAKRLERIDKIMVKTAAQRRLFPAIPDEKIAVVGNGIEWEKFQGEVERDDKLIVNTSSADRSLAALLDCFDEVRKEVPDAKLIWAYGFGTWDKIAADDAERSEWKKKIEDRMARTPGVTNAGRLGQEEIVGLYQRAAVFGYPSSFFEIFCISLAKAMASGAVPVTTDFAAMAEVTGPYGVKVPSGVTDVTWCPPGRFDFALRDEASRRAWVRATVRLLREGVPEKTRAEMRAWARRYDWDIISKEWIRLFL